MSKTLDKNKESLYIGLQNKPKKIVDGNGELLQDGDDVTYDGMKGVLIIKDGILRTKYMFYPDGKHRFELTRFEKVFKIKNQDAESI